MPDTLVFSYRRFSSGRQASGHSLERQTEAARRWCREKGYVLDESLALSDLGISAYSGDNATRGALAGFLSAVEAGRIPQNSILLVESLDRLSRAAIPEAVGLLTSIVRAGVRVVSLLDGHEWNTKTIEDTTSFLLSVLLFARAHNESSTKAKRVSEQFQKKRLAGLAVVSNGHGPGWARPRPDRQGWSLDAGKAEVVVRVFELAASGLGGTAISRRANQDGWPLPWRERKNTSTRWEHTGVSRLLRDRRVLGEWQPKKMVAGKLINDGEPVLDYFPRVVSDDLWHRVQNALSVREGPQRIRGVKADIFAGLLYCKCGERMDRKAPAGRGYARYYCLGRKHGATECPGLPETVLLGPVLSRIAQLEQKAFNPSEAVDRVREELKVNKSRLADATAKADRLLAALEEAGHSPLILGRLSAVEKEQASIEEDIRRGEAALAATPLLDRNFGHELARQAADAVHDKSDVEGRHRVSVALLQAVQRIVWHGRYLMVHARSGAAFGVNPPAAMLDRAKNRNAGKPRIAA